MTKEHFIRHGETLSATPRHYKACGLDGIFLCNGYAIEEHEGEEFMYVEDREGLHQTIAFHLVRNRKVFSGKEVRFLRTVMELTQRELADQLGTTSQTVARWEKGQTEIPDTADRLLRITFYVSLLNPEDFQQSVRELQSSLDEMNEVRDVAVHFSRNDHWAEAA